MFSFFSRKVTTHPWSTPQAITRFANYERIPLYQPIGKGCSGCVPKVCWNNLRFLGDLFQGLWWTCWKKSRFPHHGGHIQQLDTLHLGRTGMLSSQLWDQWWSVVICWFDEIWSDAALFPCFFYWCVLSLWVSAALFVLSECPTPLSAFWVDRWRRSVCQGVMFAKTDDVQVFFSANLQGLAVWLCCLKSHAFGSRLKTDGRKGSFNNLTQVIYDLIQ